MNNMSENIKEEFYQRIADKVKDYLPAVLQDVQITVEKIYKPEGIKTGLLVKSPAKNAAPVVYADDAYQAYINRDLPESVVLSNVAEHIVSAIQQTDQLEINTAFLSDFKTCSGMIQPELLNKKQNISFLNVYAYTYEKLDCIATYVMQLNDSMKLRVTNSMMESWGISKDFLRQTAILNMPDPVIQPLLKVMEDKFGIPMEGTGETPDIGLYVLTNQQFCYGAAEMMRPEVLELIGETLKGDYFILPSSIHEVLCLKDNGEMPVEALRQMVCEINQTQVEPADRLSDAIGYYSCQQKKMIDVRTEKELKDALMEPKEKKETKKKNYR